MSIRSFTGVAKRSGSQVLPGLTYSNCRAPLISLARGIAGGPSAFGWAPAGDLLGPIAAPFQRFRNEGGAAAPCFSRDRFRIGGSAATSLKPRQSMGILQDEIIDLFRAFALDETTLDPQQRAHRDRLAASYPGEWAAAQRLGLFSKEEQIARDRWSQALTRVNSTVPATMQ